MRIELKTRIENNSEAVTESGCWIWTGFINRDGYGVMKVNNRSHLAHRVSWMEHNPGAIQSSVFVCHKCDTPSCVNPDHLFAGRARDNNRDMARKGRHWNGKKNHCKHGHPLDLQNTRISSRRRFCRECDKRRHVECRNRKLAK